MRAVPSSRPLPNLLLLLLVPLAACHTAPSLPEGTGKGLVAFDPTPPPGQPTWPAPVWQVGDTTVWQRGGRQRSELRVAEAGEQGYVLVDGAGQRLRRGRDLSNVGEWPPEGDDPRHVLTPADVRFHWPLWVGKRWRCQYADRTAGGAALPIETSYHVEDLDTVTTPAGTFEALRLVRRARLLLDEGSYLDRVTVAWYAPAIGLEVRQVFGDTVVELVEWRAANR